MVQSLNTKVALTAKGISYLGIGAQYGKFLVGDRAFEFFNDNNVADYIQIPWANITAVPDFTLFNDCCRFGIRCH